MNKTIFCLMPRKLAITSEFGLLLIGWVWLQRAELTKNIHSGWICIVSPSKHLRTVLENTNKERPWGKGSRVKAPFGVSGYGSVTELSKDSNFAKVEIDGNKYIINKCDLVSAF